MLRWLASLPLIGDAAWRAGAWSLRHSDGRSKRPAQSPRPARRASASADRQQPGRDRLAHRHHALRDVAGGRPAASRARGHRASRERDAAAHAAPYEIAQGVAARGGRKARVRLSTVQVWSSSGASMPRSLAARPPGTACRRRSRRRPPSIVVLLLDDEPRPRRSPAGDQRVGQDGIEVAPQPRRRSGTCSQAVPDSSWRIASDGIMRRVILSGTLTFRPHADVERRPLRGVRPKDVSMSVETDETVEPDRGDGTPMRRRAVSMKIREVRERLTSTNGLRPAFDYELTRQFAQNTAVLLPRRPRDGPVHRAWRRRCGRAASSSPPGS